MEVDLVLVDVVASQEYVGTVSIDEREDIVVTMFLLCSTHSYKFTILPLHFFIRNRHSYILPFPERVFLQF